jgi:hypothetical protein
MSTHVNTDPTRRDIPKKSLGPVAFIALAVVVIVLVMWMMGIAFFDPGQGIENLLR